MSKNTARMQSDESLNAYADLTVKQIAALAGVSERLMYMALKLQDNGTPELLAAVNAGTITIPAALRQLGLLDKPSRLKQAKALWPKLSADEQREFWQWINEGN